MKMQRALQVLVIVAASMALQGCLTSVVTAPVKIVYGAGKLAVKGTAAAVRAVVPDGDKDKKDQPSETQQPDQPNPDQPPKP